MAGAGNPAQTQAAQPNVFQGAANALQTAGQAATGATQFQHQSLANRNLQQFQNPFQQQVLDPVLGDIERQRQMAINDVGAAATRAGAFGGSRLGVAEAETNRAALDAAARASGQLRSQGFESARGAAQQDIQNQLAAQQLGLSAAGQLGNLANLGFGFGQATQQQQAQQGAMQQALQQQLINQARNQFQQFTGSPLQSTQAPLQALGTVPFGQTQTTSQQPGLLDFASLALAFI